MAHVYYRTFDVSKDDHPVDYCIKKLGEPGASKALHEWLETLADGSLLAPASVTMPATRCYFQTRSLIFSFVPRKTAEAK